MKKYTDVFFILEVQKFYQKHRRIPKVRDFRWGSTALRRFGSWSTFLKEAKLLSTDDDDVEDYQKRKKNILWKEILSITFHQGWDSEEKKLNRVKQLRKEIDEINKQ